MFDVGGGELMLILLAILIFFGPKKIPEIAQMVGKGMAQFRKAQAEFQRNLNTISTEIQQVATLEEKKKVEPKIPPVASETVIAPSAIAENIPEATAEQFKTETTENPIAIPAKSEKITPQPAENTVSRDFPI